MAITRAEQLRAGKNCTDSTVDNNHALHTHEALHGVTAIKVYVNFFLSWLWRPLGFGALGCSSFSPLGNPGLVALPPKICVHPPPWSASIRRAGGVILGVINNTGGIVDVSLSQLRSS